MGKYGKTKVLTSTRDAFNSGKKVVVNLGGTGSGKTMSIMLYLIHLLTTQKNKIITVVSESHPHLKIGAIRYLLEITKEYGLYADKRWNKTESIFTYEHTGTLIEFFSADRIGKALGARRDYLYGNEINTFSVDVWEELARRSEHIIADFNPTSQFWLEDWIANYDDTAIIKSNYLDNPFLPDTEKQRIAKRAKRDKNFERIHIRCEYGIFSGLIFEDWQQIDELPDSGDVTFGMDFGFNDPTVLIKTIETESAYYFDEVFYQSGMLNKDIIQALEYNGIRKNYDVIIGDSAEPKSIQEIHNAGYNIKPAVKGADSIRIGIDRMKSKKIYITKRSVNLIKEFRNYAWELDKQGRQTNKPIDDWNHGIDSCRYSLSPKNNFKFHIA